MIMKQFISLLICLILLVGIFSYAYATNIDAIQPNTNIYILGITDQDVAVNGHLPTHHNNGDTIIIIPGEKLIGTEVNPITGRTVEKNTENNNTETTNNDNATAEETKKEEQEITIPDAASMDENVEEENLIKEIFALTNQERNTRDIGLLTYNHDIQKAADIRAEEISKQFSHTRPNGSNCHTVLDDIDYFVVGENIIMADIPVASASQLMNAWMNSQGHKENILLENYISMAVGVYITNDTVYAVQIFMG